MNRSGVKMSAEYPHYCEMKGPNCVKKTYLSNQDAKDFLTASLPHVPVSLSWIQ